MADPFFAIEVDKEGVIAALDAAPEGLRQVIKTESRETADIIADRARARVARRTGKTAERITVEETRNGDGYIVWVPHPDNPNLPTWLEFGTKFMKSREFLFNSAREEEGPHLRRVEEAVQEYFDDKGLGD